MADHTNAATTTTSGGFIPIPPLTSAAALRQPKTMLRMRDARDVHLNLAKKTHRTSGTKVAAGKHRALLKGAPAFVDFREAQKRLERAGRFEASTPEGQAGTVNGQLGWREKLSLLSSTQKVQGQNLALEKPYLRLCGAPDPLLVRSPEVLKVALIHVFARFFTRIRGSGGNRASLTAAYRYIEEQLRAIRQDYVVQGIRDQELFYVYYLNSAVSLIFGDLGQFNQCQCQMALLEKELNLSLVDNNFHRTLYAIVNNLDWGKESLPVAASGGPSSFLAEVQRSLRSKNFARLFRLISCSNRLSTNPADSVVVYEQLRELQGLQQALQYAKEWGKMSECFSAASDLPFLARALLRTTLSPWRMRYLCLISKAQYFCSIEDVAAWLRDDSPQRCFEYLAENGAVFNEDGQLDCAQSLPHFLASPLLKAKNKAMG